MADSRGLTQTRAVWFAALALLVALRLPYLDVPFERDEGGYGYIAQRLLLGETPYRDAFDQKPPLVFLPYALAFVTLGVSPPSVHLVLLAWSAATMLVVAAMGRRLGGPLAGAAAALVFAVASTSPRLLGFTANAEMFMLLPMTAAALCALRAAALERAAGWWLLCGALAGLACWFKQVAATSALALAAYAVVTLLRDGGPRPARRATRRLLALAAGALCVSAPIVAAFALLDGAFEPFVDGVARYNLAYARSLPLDAGLSNLHRALGLQLPAFLPLWALAAAACLLPAVRRPASLAAWWLAACAAGTAIGLHFRDHYFIQVVPALALMAGLAAAALLPRIASRPLRGALALVALVAVPTVWADRELLWAPSPAAISRAVYGPDPFPESAALARDIATGSAPHETVLVLGSEPQILLLASRKSATRMIFAHSLMLGLEGSERRRRVAAEEVRASRPRYVLLERLPGSVLEVPDVPGLAWRDPAWAVEDDYRLEALRLWSPWERTYHAFEGDEARAFVTARAEHVAGSAWLALYRRDGD